MRQLQRSNFLWKGIPRRSGINGVQLMRRFGSDLKFIETPNPNSIILVPSEGKTVLKGYDISSIEFPSAQIARSRSPLASRLFDVKGIDSVLFAENHITVTRDPSFEWHNLKPGLVDAITDFFSSGDNVIDDSQQIDPPQEEGSSKNLDPSDVASQEAISSIKEILDKKIRPALGMDGGDVEFIDFSDGLVRLRLKGACSGCPRSAITLKMGIERVLTSQVPGVKRVEQVEDFQ